MNPRRVVRAAAVSAALGAALTACTPPSHAEDAAGLRDELRELPAVESVRMEYREPVLFDAADVRIAVTMADDAPPGVVADVAGVAYRGFAGAHHDEEGNLVIEYDDDRIDLRSFEPMAAPEEVRVAVTRAAVAAEQGRLRAEVDTQWIERPPHVHTRLELRLPAGAHPERVERVRSELRASYDDDPRLVRLDVRSRGRS